MTITQEEVRYVLRQLLSSAETEWLDPANLGDPAVLRTVMVLTLALRVVDIVNPTGEPWNV